MSPYKQKQQLKKINLTIFFLGFLDAFLVYLLSAYITPLTGEKAVGWFYLATFSTVFLVLFFFHHIVRKLGQSRTLYFFLGTAILTSVLLSHFNLSWGTIALALVFIVTVNGAYVALDILLEGYSNDDMSGHIRGLNLTLMNLGLLLAPLLSVLVLKDYGYSGVFFILTLGYSITFLYALLAFRNDNHALTEKVYTFHSIQKIWQEPGLRIIYGISFTMEFFYALMIVYMPLHLLDLGVSWEQIGVLFTIMLVPFVLIEYPLGVLADKRKSEKDLLIMSLVIAALSTAGLIFITTPDFLALAILLFMTRVGIAGVEVLRDSYFYKQVDADDTDVIAFFRTTRSLANIIGTVGLLFLFIFFPLVAFLYLATFVLLLGLIMAFPLGKKKGGN